MIKPKIFIKTVKYLTHIFTQSLSNNNHQRLISSNHSQNYLGSSIQHTLNINHTSSQYCYSTNHKSFDQINRSITQKIKQAKKSTQIEDIIQIYPEKINIIHLTAILDRIEQQQMIKIENILEFVILKIKTHSKMFIDTDNNYIRTVCNIVCYVGNLMNHQLDSLFQTLNAMKIISKASPKQITMFITGLIKLNLFDNFFTLQKQQNDKIHIFLCLQNKDLNISQYLSIWMGLLKHVQYDESLHRDFLKRLQRIQLMRNDQLNLKCFSYALYVYVHTYTNFDNSKKIFIGVLEKFNPSKILSKNRLPSYQLSILLKSIKTLKMNEKKEQTNYKSDPQSQLKLPSNLQFLLESNFKRMCSQQNIILRNIANFFKQYNDVFKINFLIVLQSLRTTNKILAEQIKYISEHKQYNLDFKIDLLSLTSLFWKINEYIWKQERYSMTVQLNKLTKTLIDYLLILKQINKINLIKNNQIIMVYSGLYIFSKRNYIQLNEQSTLLLISLITDRFLTFTAKQVTLIYSYLRKLKIAQEKLCVFLNKSIHQIPSSNHNSQKVNSTLESIKKSQTCIMKYSTQCKNCLQLQQK